MTHHPPQLGLDQRPSYRPDIDGLRAIAVMGVVAYHAKLGAPGGFVGVDVFFVISGYLITRLALRDLKAGTFRLAAFWERRARRILPALAALLVAVLAMGWVVLLPADYADLARSTLWQSIFLGNFHAWRDTGYFVPEGGERPLLHLWSLAVEEQFYLLLPVLLSYIHRRWAGIQDRMLPILVAIGTVLSFAFSVLAVAHCRGVAFYLLPSRAWELGLGCLIAIIRPSLPDQIGRAGREAISAIGLLAILLPFFGYNDKTEFPGVAAVLPCLGAVLIILGGDTDQIPSGARRPYVNRTLTGIPLVFVGSISYSLYLWHWPLFAVSNYWAFAPIPTYANVGIVLVSLALAVLSWRFVERPFRAPNYAGPAILPRAALTLSLICLLASAVVVSAGFPQRHLAKWVGSRDTATFSRWNKDTFAKDIDTRNLLRLGVSDASIRAKVMLWGDSHAMAAAPAVDLYLRTKGLAGILVAHSSTPPIPGGDWKYHGTPAEESKSYKRAAFNLAMSGEIEWVLLAASWTGYTGESDGNTLAAHLLEVVSELRRKHINVTIMLQVPFQKIHGARLIALSKALRVDVSQYLAPVTNECSIPGGSAASIRQLRELGCRVIDPCPMLLDANKQRYVVEKDGISLYRDSGHLAPEGAIQIWLPLLMSEGIAPSEVN